MSLGCHSNVFFNSVCPDVHVNPDKHVDPVLHVDLDIHVDLDVDIDLDLDAVAAQTQDVGTVRLMHM